MKTYKQITESVESKNENVIEDYVNYVNDFFSKNGDYFGTFVNDVTILQNNYTIKAKYNNDDDDVDDIAYIFTEIGNDSGYKNEDKTYDLIKGFMYEIGWWDINFSLMPVKHKNKYYIGFILNQDYGELSELAMKHNAKKYNI